ncbi:sensor histidine kinase [Aeromonas rivipollensis]|uniref:sensor histidine kinase n=1 Tax=Aeromonas rivipollensis TaxID=948519 RepID=UPI00398956A0
MSNLNQVVSESMHELRYFNQRLKNLSEQMSKELGVDKLGTQTPLQCNATHADQLRTLAESILSLSQLFTTRLSFIDIELNPHTVKELNIISTNIFGKFDKARRMLNSQARDKKVKVVFEKPDQVLPNVDAYPLIDILPYLILDNAIKYSPDKNEVTVGFIKYDYSIDIVIESIGPHVPKLEIPELFRKGYRGEHAKSTDAGGSGIGLHFVKYICDLHNVSIELTSGESYYQYEGIPHSNFKVHLSFNLE